MVLVAPGIRRHGAAGLPTAMGYYFRPATRRNYNGDGGFGGGGAQHHPGGGGGGYHAEFRLTFPTSNQMDVTLRTRRGGFSYNAGSMHGRK